MDNSERSEQAGGQAFRFFKLSPSTRHRAELDAPANLRRNTERYTEMLYNYY